MRCSILYSLSLFVCSSLASAQCEQVGFASDGGAGDDFGYSMAADGDVLVVGARHDSDLGFWSGSAYVYERTGPAAPWTEVAKLTASDFESGALFGRGVAVHDDRIVIGAPGDNSNAVGAGAAYVFDKLGGQWTETAKLVPVGADFGDWVGFAVALHDDRVLLGAQGDDFLGPFTGAAYIFEKTGGAWQETAYLSASDANPADYFSFAVALDEDTAVIGAYGNDDHGSGSGSAYVFEMQGQAWLETQKLTASDAAVIDFFGWSIALDDDTLLVGAYGKNIVGGLDGAAYVYKEQGGVWLEQQRLTPAVQDVDGQFGFSVDVEGTHAIVGAVYADHFGAHSGAAFVFEESAGYWTERARTEHPGQAGDDQLGWSVAATDGTVIAGAAPVANEGSFASFDGPFEDCNGNGRVDHCDIASGTSLDLDGNGVPDECLAISAFCFCAAGAPCNGGNEPTAGCRNSRGIGGTFSYASGTTSVAADDLTLTAGDLPNLAFALVFMGQAPMNPAPLGDGLRCVALPFHRFPVQTTGLTGSFDLGPGIVQTALQGAGQPINAGETWHFQCWYRDPLSSCATSNLTNALTVTFGL